jgi:exportin-T
MDPNDIEVAIQITWSHGGDPSLRAQALNFVNDLRTNVAAWSACLALFTRPNPPADEPVRHFCLEVVCNCIPHLDAESLELVKEQLTRYVESRYGEAGDDGRTDTGPIQNKLCQALTVLFVQLYPTSWLGFFPEFLAWTKQGANVQGTLLYFRLLLSIHDEIGDIIINREVDQSNRNVTLKDLVRDRDAEKIAAFWQEMLARKEQLDLHVLELCLKSISRWISWSDISLVVNQMVLNTLLDLASQQGLEPGMVMQTKVRDAALEAFTEIASKKMRPSEKVELIQVLKLETVISQLVSSPGLLEFSNTPKYDTDLAELVAKLVGNIVRDIVVVLDSSGADEQTKTTAHEILLTFLPFLLRFFSDEYDEVCSMVIDGLSEVLGFLRRISLDKQPVAQTYAQILPSFLQAIVGKMKYDETANWEEDEDAEEVEFMELRRRLQALQKQVFAIDEQMTITGISQLVQQTFRKVAENPDATDWRELDLALYELNSFGDFAVKPAAIANPQRGGLGVEQLKVMMQEMMTCSKFL